MKQPALGGRRLESEFSQIQWNWRNLEVYFLKQYQEMDQVILSCEFGEFDFLNKFSFFASCEPFKTYSNASIVSMIRRDVDLSLFINKVYGNAKAGFRYGPGGGTQLFFFFQVGVYDPDFRSVGLANWHLPLTRGACERKKFPNLGGLWAENFQIWGLVS